MTVPDETGGRVVPGAGAAGTPASRSATTASATTSPSGSISREVEPDPRGSGR